MGILILSLVALVFHHYVGCLVVMHNISGHGFILIYPAEDFIMLVSFLGESAVIITCIAPCSFHLSALFLPEPPNVFILDLVIVMCMFRSLSYFSSLLFCHKIFKFPSSSFAQLFLFNPFNLLGFSFKNYFPHNFFLSIFPLIVAYFLWHLFFILTSYFTQCYIWSFQFFFFISNVLVVVILLL